MTRFWSCMTSLALVLCIFSCSSQSSENTAPQINASKNFGQYWYQGKAELNRYKLTQARYGELHSGEVVLVFVTEDLSNTKHVKTDDPKKKDYTPVLKLNYVKKFITGIYDYSMMMSVFNPVYKETARDVMRITTSSQEWCGHTFERIDKTENGYAVVSNSYFPNEADTSYQTKNALTEDGILNMMRIAPELLPKGKLEMIPSTFFCRLKHLYPKPYTVQAKISSLEADTVQYTLEYPDLERVVNIRFINKFPYQVTGWDDTYVSGWGNKAKKLTTVASLTNSSMSAYWGEHQNKDQKLRDKLGIEFKLNE